MSNPLVKGNGGGAIVNPFAKKILSLEVLDDGTMNLHAPSVPPNTICKILTGMMIDLFFQSYTQPGQPSESEKKIIG